MGVKPGKHPPPLGPTNVLKDLKVGGEAAEEVAAPSSPAIMGGSAPFDASRMSDDDLLLALSGKLLAAQS